MGASTEKGLPPRIQGPQFTSNCLMTAVLFTLGGGRIRTTRNHLGRLHWYWTDSEGLAWDFFAPGAGDRTYLGNIWYRGHLRRIPKLDGARS